AAAVRPHARQPRDRHLQRAQLEHRADLQRHLLDGQPGAVGHADADHAGALRQGGGADRFLNLVVLGPWFLVLGPSLVLGADQGPWTKDGPRTKNYGPRTVFSSPTGVK